MGNLLNLFTTGRKNYHIGFLMRHIGGRIIAISHQIDCTRPYVSYPNDSFDFGDSRVLLMISSLF